MFRRFGSRVTVIQNGKQLLTKEDADIADEIAAILREDGIEILLEAKAESVAMAGGNRAHERQHEKREQELEGTHLLVATGRQAQYRKAQSAGGRHRHR